MQTFLIFFIYLFADPMQPHFLHDVPDYLAPSQKEILNKTNAKILVS